MYEGIVEFSCAGRNDDGSQYPVESYAFLAAFMSVVRRRAVLFRPDFLALRFSTV